jgi:nickel-dependent lactate racemase
MAVTGTGYADRMLSPREITEICDEALSRIPLDGRRVLFLVPDLTRTCPLDLLFRVVYRCLAGRVAHVDFMIALGTHPPLSQAQIHQRFGLSAQDHARHFPQARFFNHAWDDPEQLTDLGTIDKAELGRLTDGLFEMEISVQANRAVREYDHLVILGPVFPHEVVGFSGGNKYIFPGISGPEILHFFHWLGAMITNPRIIGVKWTPVRKVVDRAAAMLPLRRHALCMVVREDGLAGLYAGSPEEAWSAAADLSRKLHVVYKEHPFHTVLSCAPAMYDELWVGGKCAYKLEPVVADGGRLIIYAPHLRVVSVVHGERIRQIGYHVRDYFLSRWEEVRDIPWGILAHSTHVKGIGRMVDGMEHPRIEVILATGIPEAVCREINLGYLDPASIDPAEYRDREGEGVLYVPRAGETLYRLTRPPPELGGESAEPAA